MKNILLDFCLVLLVLMLAGQFLNPDYLKTEQQKSALDSFNQDVRQGQTLQSSYLSSRVDEENQVSQFVGEVSDLSRQAISNTVYFFSGLLQNLFES
ncbi:hypothetical protein BN3662_01823 [Clostridiales bacterium CHKCI006]|uniref:Uncharacterized protein n=1 Tax=Candidatus Fimiplasma intestinipullorum TaxID=2840825 RepID=A0A9D1HQ82_9FIRM|nr:hypothetical protein BN3662_01823 [Clostridiales bacterium CHKCI006]HIU14730.1 hypothetical protein [Candidatus Fimiplasma intestinipullorum]